MPMTHLLSLFLPAINVIITGQADTEWKERDKKEQNGSTKKSTETFKGRKLYFEQMLPLVNHLSVHEFGAGTHTFPFAYELAQNLPPSIKGVHGNCTYMVKAILDRAWRPNEIIKKEFTVATRYLFPLAMLAPSYEETKEELWSLPFTTSTFKLNVEVAQQAFRLGEGIPVSVELSQLANTTIYEIKFQLRQLLHFYSQQPMRRCKTEYKKIVDIRCKVMDSRKEGKFQRVLQIPHVPVTYITHSELTGITYEVRVEVKLGGLNKNPVVEIPVVIGTGMMGEGAAYGAASLGFESMLMASPARVAGGGGAALLNMSQMSSYSMSSTTTSQASVSLMDSSSTSTPTAPMLVDQAAGPPSYHEVVPAGGGMMKQ